MALVNSDQFVLYRPTDSSNRKTSMQDITSFVQATTASNLQEITDNGSTTTNTITVNKDDSTAYALIVNLAADAKFSVNGNGDIAAAGNLLISDRSGIESTGLITAFRKSSNVSDNLQLWKSNKDGITGTQVAHMDCGGNLAIAGVFSGDGSGLTNLNVPTPSLQTVTDAGATTSTAVSFTHTGLSNDYTQIAGSVVKISQQGAGTAGNLVFVVNGDSSQPAISMGTDGTIVTTGAVQFGNNLSCYGSIDVNGDITSSTGGFACLSYISTLSGVVAGGTSSGAVGTACLNSDASVSSNAANSTQTAFIAQLNGVEKAKILSDGTISGTTIVNTVPLDAWTDIPLLT